MKTETDKLNDLIEAHRINAEVLKKIAHALTVFDQRILELEMGMQKIQEKESPIIRV